MIKSYYDRAVNLCRLMYKRDYDLQTEEGRGLERYRRGILTTGVMLLFKISTILMNIITIPLILKYLKEDLSGVWMIITGLVEFAGFYDLGLGVGLRNLLIKCNAAADDRHARQLIANGMAVLFVLSLILVLAVFFVIPLLPWTTIIRCKEAAASAQIVPAMSAALLAFAVGLPLMQILNVTVAYQRGYWGYSFFLLGRFSAFVFIFLCFAYRLPFWALTGGYLGIPYLCLIGGWIAFFRKYPGLFPRRIEVNFGYIRQLFGVGCWLAVHELGYSAINVSPLVILGNTIGAASTIPYSLTMKLLNTTTIFASAYRTGIYGAVGEAWHTGDLSWVRGILKKTVAVWFLTTWSLLLMFIFIGPFIIRIWTGNPVAVPSHLLVFLCALVVAFSIAGSLVSGFLLSMNFVQFVAICSVVCAGLQIGFCYLAGAVTQSVNTVVTTNFIFGMLLPLGVYAYYLACKMRDRVRSFREKGW